VDCPLPKDFSCPFEKVDKRHLAIVSCSNFVFPRPSDWNENIHQDGYWFVEEKSEYTPSKELSDFLAKGEKPVYIGFGSQVASDKCTPRISSWQLCTYTRRRRMDYGSFG